MQSNVLCVIAFSHATGHNIAVLNLYRSVSTYRSQRLKKQHNSTVDFFKWQLTSLVDRVSITELGGFWQWW